MYKLALQILSVHSNSFLYIGYVAREREWGERGKEDRQTDTERKEGRDGREGKWA